MTEKPRPSALRQVTSVAEAAVHQTSLKLYVWPFLMIFVVSGDQIVSPWQISRARAASMIASPYASWQSPGLAACQPDGGITSQRTVLPSWPSNRQVTVAVSLSNCGTDEVAESSIAPAGGPSFTGGGAAVGVGVGAGVVGVAVGAGVVGVAVGVTGVVADCVGDEVVGDGVRSGSSEVLPHPLTSTTAREQAAIRRGSAM